MEPNDQESQLLWDSLIEHGRKYLGNMNILIDLVPINNYTPLI